MKYVCAFLVLSISNAFAIISNPNCPGGVGSHTISYTDGNYQSSFNTRICYQANGEWSGDAICSDANGSFDNIDLSSAGYMTHNECC